MTWSEYKQMLIRGILMFQTRNQYTEEQLKKKTIRSLEIIYDNIQ